MKYCPVCSERYDEDVIRFCTKDGAPLIDEVQPTFTAIPSETVEDDDDLGQETIVRRKPLVPGDQPLVFDTQGQSERIVIPTSEPQTSQVRTRAAQGFVVPPPPPNTARTVFLTIIGTLFVLGIGVGIFWLLKKDTPVSNSNVNINANQNTNLNTNLGFDSNFNFNANFNSNSNTNFNLNSNLNTSTNANSNTNTRPSPTPKPSPSPSPVKSPTPEPSDTPSPSNTRPPVNTQPTPVGTPRIGPRPPPLTNRPPGNVNG